MTAQPPNAFVQALASEGITEEMLASLCEADVRVIARHITRLSSALGWDPLDPQTMVRLNTGTQKLRWAFFAPISQIVDDPRIVSMLIEQGFATVGHLLALGRPGLAELPLFAAKRIDYVDAAMRGAGLSLPKTTQLKLAFYRHPGDGRYFRVHSDFAALALEFEQLRFATGRIYLDLAALDGLTSFEAVLLCDEKKLHEKVVCGLTVPPRAAQTKLFDAGKLFARRLAAVAVFHNEFYTLK